MDQALLGQPREAVAQHRVALTDLGPWVCAWVASSHCPTLRPSPLTLTQLTGTRQISSHWFFRAAEPRPAPVSRTAQPTSVRRDRPTCRPARSRDPDSIPRSECCPGSPNLARPHRGCSVTSTIDRRFLARCTGDPRHREPPVTQSPTGMADGRHRRSSSNGRGHRGRPSRSTVLRTSAPIQTSGFKGV